MKRDQCCNHDCQQGKTCPMRAAPADRRAGATWFWRWFGWLMAERRSGVDRRRP